MIRCLKKPNLKEIIVKLNSYVDIENGGPGVTDEVAGDDLLVGNAQNSFHWALGGLANLGNNFSVLGRPEKDSAHFWIEG